MKIFSVFFKHHSIYSEVLFKQQWQLELYHIRKTDRLFWDKNIPTGFVNLELYVNFILTKEDT